MIYTDEKIDRLNEKIDRLNEKIDRLDEKNDSYLYNNFMEV